MLSWNPESWEQDPENWTWDTDSWYPRPAPQILLTLIMKHNFENKNLSIWVENLGARVDGLKHLPKYFDIWHNTKNLENI